MHDNYIVSYNVNLKQRALIIQTYNKTKKEEENIVFFDVLTHSFKCILDYNQVLDISDYRIDSFFNDNQIDIKEMHRYCWPIDYQDEKELKEFLIANEYKYIKISSSYGMFGWVLAKSYQIN